MKTQHVYALLIAAGVVLALWAVRRLVWGPPAKRAPLWASLCRGLLLLGATLWYALPVAGGVICFALTPPLLLIAAAGLAFHLYRRGVSPPGTSCGSARAADHYDLLEVGAFGGAGLLLGTFPPPRIKDAFRLLWNLPGRDKPGAVIACLAALVRRPLWVRLPGQIHVGIFCRTGGGKTSGFVIPHLLTDDDSAVVIDPSGEIYAATHESRRRRGHQIVVLDPARLTGATTDALNPMAGLRTDDPEFLDHCRALATALVPKAGSKSADPHWEESAVTWIAAVIAWTVFVTEKRGEPDLCNLQTVADILADQGELDTAMAMLKKEKALGGMLARMGHKLGHAVDRERGSILSTIARTLSFLDTPAVAAVTGHSTFDPGEKRKRKVTNYLVLKPEAIREKAGLVRAWLTAFFRADLAAGTKGGLVHYVLDEFGSLGQRLDCVTDALTQYRKYGVRLQIYLQGTGQLEQCFGEGMDKTFLANVVQVFVGTNDLDTAKYVSESCGTATVATLQQSAGGNWSSGSDSNGMLNRSDGGNDGTSLSEKERPLLTPEEVRGLGDRIAVTFAPNLPPIFTSVVRHYEPQFQSALCPPSPAAAVGGSLAFLASGATAAAAAAGVAAAAVAPPRW